ncbi:MAG TPA: hypothetical protein PK867_15970 [Pirellulales bacterium]|nr:hypothetical protein [Pirellulales bacterium]
MTTSPHLPVVQMSESRMVTRGPVDPTSPPSLKKRQLRKSAVDGLVRLKKAVGWDAVK